MSAGQRAVCLRWERKSAEAAERMSARPILAATRMTKSEGRRQTKAEGRRQEAEVNGVCLLLLPSAFCLLPSAFCLPPSSRRLHLIQPALRLVGVVALGELRD